MSRQSFIQHPITHELIPKDQYVRPKSVQAAAVFGDIEPFISSVDKTLVSGRKSMEEHNRRNNVVSAADLTPEVVERMQKERDKPPSRKEVQARREQINEAIEYTRRTGQKPRIGTFEQDHKDWMS